MPAVLAFSDMFGRVGASAEVIITSSISRQVIVQFLCVHLYS